MTATNHVLTGAVVATYVHNPWIALPVALASHFALDMVPHFRYPGKSANDPKFLLTLAIDAALAASILLSLLVLQPSDFILLVACGVAAASPDLMWLYYLVYKKGKGEAKWPFIVRFHAKIQRERYRYFAIEAVWFVVMGGLLVSRLQ